MKIGTRVSMTNGKRTITGTVTAQAARPGTVHVKFDSGGFSLAPIALLKVVA